jgi:hypothetical protein
MTTVESNNFSKLINRLSSSLALYKYTKNDEFHSNLIKNALKYYPIEFLWSYLDLYK